MGIEVLVVQHGEKVHSPGDPGLTPVGHQQAAMTGSWLSSTRTGIESIWTSPLLRARETAATIAVALGLDAKTDVRFRERMNWDDAAMSFGAFVAEWRRSTDDPFYQPMIGDSASAAAERFVAALIDIEQHTRQGVVVVVAHGGVTVEVLRAVDGDETVGATDPSLIDHGVPCCAITTLRVVDGSVTVTKYPSTDHLDRTTEHRVGR
jgi:broad specificity phosphatase PhoE